MTKKLAKLKRKSKQHVAVYKILKRLYPTARILQDAPIKIGRKTLFIDIYLPRYNLAFEVNGEQHYEYNSFMHKNRYSFQQQKENDSLKRLYCEDNNIRLCVVAYDQDVTTELILNLIKGEEE